jgi:fibronectin-binding autotransporter adhesin
MSRKLRRLTAPATLRRRPVSPKARLWLRALEDRIAPATFTVTNTGDTGAGSGTSGDLRYCITQSNAIAGQNTIDATGVSGTIGLTGGVLTIANSLTITGPSNNGLVISGNNANQVFTISGAGQTVVFKNLEITGGNTAASGGAVYCGSNTVTFDTDWIHGNQTSYYGGGIAAAAGAAITVRNSAITGNSASSGGAIYASGMGSPSIVVQNSTLSGNTAGSSGGAIDVAGSQGPGPGPFYPRGYLPGILSIRNTTVTGNTANVGGGLAVGGYKYLPIDLTSSIVSANGLSGANAGYPDLYASAASANHSAIGSTTGITHFHDLGGNVFGLLSLQPLTFNGGPTPTIALWTGSPTIHAGSNPDGLAFDQRGAGYPRTTPPGLADIGAFQLQPGASAPSATAIGPSVAGTNPPVTYHFTVTYTDAAAVRYSTVNGNSNAVTVTPPAGVAPVAVSFVSATPTGDAASNTATYQFTFPAGLQSGADNGAWIIQLAPNQVENVNNNFTGYGPLTTFLVQVPRILMVTNANAFGTGSFLDAVNKANFDAPSADAIVFSNSTANGATNFYAGAARTISLANALPTITNAVTITGPGSSLLTINANHFGSVLSLGSPVGSTVTLSGLTLTGGVAGNGIGGGIDAQSCNLALTDLTVSGNSGDSGGGGIDCYGNLSLTNCTVTGNSTGHYSSGGGGIAAGHSTAIITIVNSTISNNSSGGGGNGGGIEAGALTMTITNSTIANNQDGGGGGIYCTTYGTFTITGSTLIGNTAGFYGGGALSLDNGSATATVTVNDCTIVNNTAAGATGYGYASGGGIGLLGFKSTNAVRIISSTITGNSAAATATNNSGYGGGGISERYGSGPINLDNTIVSGNFAANGRTDIAVLGGVTVTTAYSAIGNTTGFTYTPGPGDLTAGINLSLLPLFDNGGPTRTAALGVGSPAIDHGDPALASSTDQRGVARPQGAGVDIGGYERIPGLGGAATASNVVIAGGTIYTFTVTYADTVAINTASLGSGNVTVSGVLTVGGTVSPAVTFVSVNVTNPKSVVATYQFTPPGGAWASIYNGTYTITMQPNQVSDANGFVPAGPIGAFTVTATEPLVVTNTNDSGPGSLRAAVTTADADAPAVEFIQFSNSTAGGATNFYDGTQHTIALFSALPTITDPVTVTGPGSTMLTVTRGAGSIRILDVNAGLLAVNISGLTISNGNTGAVSGGGIQNAASALTLTDVTVANNTIAGNGAGIYVSGPGMLTLINSRVVNNSTSAIGAGIYLAGGGVANISNSTVSQNSAGSSGGGIYNTAGGTVNITTSTLSNDSAGASGGGICNATGGVVNVTNSTVSSDTATSYAGGIYNAGGGALNVTNSMVSNDSAISGGGGIFSGGTLAISNTTLSLDQANYGGAIETSGVGNSLVVTNSTIVNNGANSGGAIYCGGASALTINASTLSGNTAAASGGAIYSFFGSGTVNISNSTLANNTAGTNGGAMLLYSFGGTITVTSSSITGNTATSTTGSPAYSGGIVIKSGAGRLNLESTIVSGNSIASGNSDIAAANSAAVTTAYSAIGSTTGFTYTPGPGDLPVGANLNLQPLANNGGPTQTVALGSGSAAIDHGDPTTGLTSDQRGFARVFGPAPDIGAFEAQPFKVAAVAVNDGNAQRSEVRSITITFSGPVTFAGGNANAAAAFLLNHVQTGANVILSARVTTDSQGRTAVTLGFSGGETDPVSARNGGAPSLADGRYQLAVLGSAVIGPDGLSLDGNADGTPGGNYISPADTLGGGPGQLHLYRIFGDTNGDGVVDQQDLGQFRTTFNADNTSPLYLAFLDADNSGSIDQLDLGQFRSRFNANVF